MSKLYGYKEKDVIEFNKFIKENKNLSLTRAFEEYAKLSGKAKGSVRNMYYAMAKKAKEDKAFKEKYLDNAEFSVNKANEFSDEEFNEMLDYIIIAKKQGKSVRKATGELAKGDIKLALRYQNKYRNAIKNDSKIKEIMQNASDNYATKMVKNAVPEAIFDRLKEEINRLINRITLKEKEINQILKDRIYALELENASLSQKLYGSERFFNYQKEENIS